MKLTKTIVTAAISALMMPAFAQAACTISDVTSKNWRVSGTELTGTLFFCRVPVGAATNTTTASIPAVTNACQDTYLTGAQGQTFANPTVYSITSGTIVLANANQCIFNATVNLAGGYTLRAILNLDSGKTVATGNFLVSWGSGGSISMVRY